jgi:hypothetical protein
MFESSCFKFGHVELVGELVDGFTACCLIGRCAIVV